MTKVHQITTKTLRADRMRGGKEILSSKPKTIPMRIPSIAEQVHDLTRLGVARANAYWDDNDTWNDHLDDLPNEGLTEHEINGDPELLKLTKKQTSKKPSNPLSTTPSGASEDKQKEVADLPIAEQDTQDKK